MHLRPARRGHDQDRHRRRRHGVRQGPICLRAARRRTQTGGGEERRGAAGASEERPRPCRPDRARPPTAACWRRRARARDPEAGNRAVPILVFSGTVAAPTRCASSRRWASPATSTSTAPCSTSCRRWRRISSRTISTAAAVRACPRHPGRVSLRQHDRRGADAEPEQGRDRDPDDEPARGGREGEGPVPAAGIEAGRRGRSRVAWSDRRVGWACSSNGWTPPTRRRSTSSSISTSSATVKLARSEAQPAVQARSRARQDLRLSLPAFSSRIAFATR